VVAVPLLANFPIPVFTGVGLVISAASTKLPNTKHNSNVLNARLNSIILISRYRTLPRQLTTPQRTNELKKRRRDKIKVGRQEVSTCFLYR